MWQPCKSPVKSSKPCLPVQEPPATYQTHPPSSVDVYIDYKTEKIATPMPPTFDWLSFLFWTIFLLLVMQPALARHAIQRARRRLLAQIQAQERARVITLVHREETISFLGVPLHRYLTMEDSEEVLRAIATTPPDQPIHFVLHTPGGLVIAAMQIARALASHPAPTKVIVPHFAMSGGTLIALAADEIVMGSQAVLGPLDPQLQGYPAPSLLRLKREKPIEAIGDQWLVLADIAEKAIRQVEEFVYFLLEKKVGAQKAREIAHALVHGYWSHDYPLTADVLRQWGLPVSTNLPPIYYDLMMLYRQPLRQRPATVEFLPADSHE